jgi:hypothetical protein
MNSIEREKREEKEKGRCLMKKILAALLVLALVAPAMADVAITATDEGSGHLKITVAPTGGAVIRGLALKLTRTAGDASLTDFNDVDTTQFNTFIDYAFDNAGYTIGAGHPAAKVASAGVVGLPATTFVLSAGYVDEGGNQGGITVDSFFDVFFDITATSTIAMELDTLRGGIVGDTLGTVTVEASQDLVMDFITGTLVVNKTTAAPAIATRVNGGRVETFVASGITGSGTLEYNFDWGDTTSSGFQSLATLSHTYTYTAAATYNVTVTARLVSNTSISTTSAPIALTTEPVKSTATFYLAWTQWNRPNCWAFQRNCRGDIDGIISGPFWVAIPDLNVFKAAFSKDDATLATVTNGICADFDRIKSGPFRVAIPDLTTFKAYFSKPVASVPVCSQTNYHYWTN